MTEPGFRVDDVDFDAFYQGRPPVEGMSVTFTAMPWDIGAPQPALVALEAAGALRGDVLDAGCGLGNNAIFLAERGHRVTGVDGAQPALEAARRRAAEHGVDVEFRHADVTTLDGVPQRFGTVLDSALYHCLNAEQRTAYAAALHRVTLPGATLHLFCFADTDDQGLGLPMSVSQEDLREHLGTHWDIRGIEPGDYTTSLTRRTFDEMGRDRLGGAGLTIDPATLRTDDQGRILARVWYLHAERAAAA
jgi:SAM-dependent methyltransferase